jgi:hypothetical protein
MSRSYRPDSTTATPARRVLAVAVACGFAGLVVAACSASAPPSAGVASGAGGAVGSAPSAGRAAAPEPAPAAGSQPGNTTDLAKLAQSQSLIYTASLTIQVKDVTGTATKASNDVTSVGGYVANEQETIPASKHAMAQVTLQLKIPVTAYQATLPELSALGREVSLSKQTQDVTQQVADVGSRVASDQAAIKQLRALLSRAGDVASLLSVQDEINSQEADLESLLAQQQALDHETSYGTVTMQINGPKAKTVHKKKPKTHHGLVAGLGTGWRALKAVVVWLLTALGTILPFAIPVAVIGGVIYVGRRRITRRRRSQPAGTA